MRFRGACSAILSASALMAISHAANARVFSYKDADLAPYLRVTGGLSSLGKSAFENSSGTDTGIEASCKYDYSGEIGIAVGLGQALRLRVGAELMQHRPIRDASGFNPAGTERFRLDSSVSVFNPNLTFEYAYKTSGNLKLYAMAGAGLADVTVENKYAMTAQGTTDLGVSSFTEKMSGSGTEAHAGMGLETLFTDNVTFSLDVGYRYLPIKSLKYKDDVNNIVAPSGSHAGAEVVNQDGSKRSLNLGGVMIGLSFRFYLSFI